jgi:flagellar biosynthesis/type III secretory pathway ATPase
VIARGTGIVKRTLGETVLVALPGARVGDGVRIHRSAGTMLLGEVAAVERARVAIAPFGSVAGVAVGDRVEVAAEALSCPAGFGVLGRALDPAGAPLDGRGALGGTGIRVDRDGAPLPGARAPVELPLWTGIRAIDALATIGRGARVGIFGAPSGWKDDLARDDRRERSRRRRRACTRRRTRA